MSKVCQITGKKAITGNNVSHSKRRTKRKFNVNVFNRKFYWPEQGQWLTRWVSTLPSRRLPRKDTSPKSKLSTSKKGTELWQRKQKATACK